MKLYDLNAEREYTLPELFNEWKYFRKEEPYNHEDDFKTELYVILMDTINGRNDCDIVGLTPAETSRYIERIRLGLGRIKGGLV